MPDRRPTLKALAEVLGVHSSTVSRALARDHRIRPEVIAQVQAVAEAMGYVRDPALSALAESRWSGGTRTRAVNFGFLSYASESRIQRSDLFQACRRQAESRGFPLIPLTLDPTDPERLQRQLRAMNIRGVLVGELQQPDAPAPDAEQFPWKEAVWVEVEDNANFLHIHAVQSNAFRTTSRALDILVQKGFRRILFARQSTGRRRVVRRQEAAFLLARAEHPEVAFYDWAIDVSPPTIGPKERAFQPDVLLSTYYMLGKTASRQLGRLPWASLGMGSEREKVPAAGMQFKRSLRAEAALDLLEQQYRRGAYGMPADRQVIMLDCEWHEGKTLSRSRASP